MEWAWTGVGDALAPMVCCSFSTIRPSSECPASPFPARCCPKLAIGSVPWSEGETSTTGAVAFPGEDAFFETDADRRAPQPRTLARDRGTGPLPENAAAIGGEGLPGANNTARRLPERRAAARVFFCGRRKPRATGTLDVAVSKARKASTMLADRDEPRRRKKGRLVDVVLAVVLAVAVEDENRRLCLHRILSGQRIEILFCMGIVLCFTLWCCSGCNAVGLLAPCHRRIVNQR